jgi:hypothetical protein
MRKFKLLILILFSAFGLFGQRIDINAQTPPSLNCPNVTVTFASSAAYAPLTASGVGAPRVCLPQCSTSVASCITNQATTISATFSGTGLGTISNRVWSTEGDIAINGPTNGTTVSIYSTLSSATPPYLYGKGRLKLSYTNTTGVCGCAGFVTLDVFKKVSPLPSTQIAGPTCVAINELVTYSISPDFSSNVNVGIGLDNNYRWTPPGTFTQNYASGDNSSRTYTVGSSFTGGTIQINPGSSTANAGQNVPGTGCNTLATPAVAIGIKPANFKLNLTNTAGYTITGASNNSSAITACVDVGAVAAATLSILPPTESGTTYTPSSPNTSIPLSNQLAASVLVNPTATGSGSVSYVATRPAPTCGSASATFTITDRKLPPSTTFTRLSTNFGTPSGTVYCLRPGTYTFQLSGPVNLPAGLVTAANTGLPTALGSWSWNPVTNVMTLIVTASGSSTTYNIGLTGVTCSNGNISVPDQYRLASPGTASFTLNNLGCGGNFDVTTTAFSPLSSCRFGFKYRWTVTPSTVLFSNNGSNVYEGCGLNSAQLETTTIPATGCVVSCQISIPTIAPLCPVPGSCTNCTAFTVTGTNPQTFTVPSNTETYLLPCLVAPGGGNNWSNKGISNSAFDFEISPNPTSGFLKVNLSKNSSEYVRIAVCDPKGRILFSETQKSNVFDIDCSSLESGVYYVRIQSDKDLKIKQFIKK